VDWETLWRRIEESEENQKRFEKVMKEIDWSDPIKSVVDLTKKGQLAWRQYIADNYGCGYATVFNSRIEIRIDKYIIVVNHDPGGNWLLTLWLKLKPRVYETYKLQFKDKMNYFTPISFDYYPNEQIGEKLIKECFELAAKNANV